MGLAKVCLQTPRIRVYSHERCPQKAIAIHSVHTAKRKLYASLTGDLSIVSEDDELPLPNQDEEPRAASTPHTCIFHGRRGERMGAVHDLIAGQM